MTVSDHITDADRAREWRSVLTNLTLGLLVFETLTGLSIYLLPFSVPNQIMVLLHTAVGLVFIVPALIYTVRHWLLYRKSPMSHYKLTGYLSIPVLALCVASGVILTVQALFSTRISPLWDMVHIVTTFLIVAGVGAHVLLLLIRSRRRRAEQAALVLAGQRTFLKANGWILGTSALAVAILSVVAPQPDLQDGFSADYVYPYGEDRPFAPSLARTASGDAVDPRLFSGSASCGTSGCHQDIYEQWKVSAHRYSAMDPAFQAIQKVMAQQNGPESTRYCGGCHDPISLFSGAKNVFNEDLTNLDGYQEGVSCIACHAIRETDLKGNADYVITPPRRYLGELSDTSLGKGISDFLIRAYPAYHSASLGKKLFKTPEYCAACHKQFIDEEVNNVGWVQLQNQYDNWRKSRWNTPGDPTKTIECRECHMPLLASSDPSSGDDLDYNRTSRDGTVRSHRFLGANQFIPGLLDLEGADAHTELIEAWLRGDIAIPEIEDKWGSGPAVGLELQMPDVVEPGAEIPVKVIVTSNKVGHDFPTGPLDIIQTWVELTVSDQSGNVIYSSGHVDETGFIDSGTFMFKAEPVDQYGNLIDRHNLWEMVGVRYRRSLFPGFSDAADYMVVCPTSFPAVPREELDAGDSGQRVEEFSIPATDVGTLEVTARLRYRKVDQYLLNFAFGEDSGLTSPITDISEVRDRIRVVASS